MKSSIEQTEVLAALYKMKDLLTSLEECLTRSTDLNQHWRDTLHGLHTRIQMSQNVQYAQSFWWLGGYNDSMKLHLDLLRRILEKARAEATSLIEEVESV